MPIQSDSDDPFFDTPPPAQQDYDRRLGAVIRELRTTRGWSQADLATAMTNDGVAWHQQTVLKVEKGQRPVRLQEAESLSKVLQMSLDTMIGDSSSIRAAVRLSVQAEKVFRLCEAISADINELYAEAELLGYDLSTIARNGSWEAVDKKMLSQLAAVATHPYLSMTLGDFSHEVTSDGAVAVASSNMEPFNPEAW